MSLATAQAALIAAAIQQLGGIPTEFENVEFTKPTNAKWAQMFFIPNTPEVETLGPTGEDLATGLLQVNVNYPMDTGTLAATADFEAFRAGFPAGRHITIAADALQIGPLADAAFDDADQVVTIINCGRSQGRLVDNWYRVSFTVGWQALIPR